MRATENGGIAGHVIYASTRPFDDPSLSLQLQWEPGVPRVTINLYSEGVDDFGNKKLTLVDTTTTTSWDDWAQGFRHDAAGNLIKQADGSYIPNMNCPGQDSTSPFFATLKNSKQWLDTADATGNKKPLANNSQFKCYDGWSQLNQIQPAPYDGMYKFPSVTAVDPTTGKPSKTNCTGLLRRPDTPTGRQSDAPGRQVRGRSDRAAGLRTRERRGQEHSAGRCVHRAGDAAVRRLRQHLHHARPGGGERGYTTRTTRAV